MCGRALQLYKIDPPYTEPYYGCVRWAGSYLFFFFTRFYIGEVNIKQLKIKKHFIFLFLCIKMYNDKFLCKLWKNCLGGTK